MKQNDDPKNGRPEEPSIPAGPDDPARRRVLGGLAAVGVG